MTAHIEIDAAKTPVASDAHPYAPCSDIWRSARFDNGLPCDCEKITSATGTD